MSYLYASDLKIEKQTDTFMGEGFEKALKEARENGNDLIIGEFYENIRWVEG